MTMIETCCILGNFNIVKAGAEFSHFCFYSHKVYIFVAVYVVFKKPSDVQLTDVSPENRRRTRGGEHLNLPGWR